MSEPSTQGKVRVIMIDRPTYRGEAEVTGTEEKFKQVMGTVSMGELESQLRELIDVFETVASIGKSYAVDQAKATVGVSRDDKGNLHLGLAAKFMGIFGIEASKEKSETTGINEIIEITIKRKSSA